MLESSRAHEPVAFRNTNMGAVVTWWGTVNRFRGAHGRGQSQSHKKCVRANDPRRLVGYLNSRQRSYLLVWAGVAGGKLSFIRITEYRSSNSPPLENSYKCHQSTQKMLFFFPSVASTPTASWLLSQIFVQASKQASCTTSRSLRKSF